MVMLSTLSRALAISVFSVVGLMPQSSMAKEAASAIPASGPPASMPWMNMALSPDTRADLLQAQMTQDERIQLLRGHFGADMHWSFMKPVPEDIRPMLPGTAGFIPGIVRLGIPSLIESDAGVGIANSFHMRPGDQATALPSGIMMAATWNPDLAQAVGAVLGTEARDRAFNVVLAGAMNLARDPRGGRTFEYAGEDPLLAGAITGAAVKGIQSQHVISTVKHFAFNDQETGRSAYSANIEEAAARESDLLAFQIAIEEGEPGSVMCAYNRYNGTYSCENAFLLTDVLKRDWKYPGWVMSDWGAVHSTAEAAKAGLDQQSASGFDHKDYFGAPALTQALADGSIDAARFHDMVHRILRSMFAIGLFDHPAARQPSDVEAHRAVAQRGAEEGIVLLKNNPGVLPLKQPLKSIAVIGPHADIGMLSGGGSSQVMPLGHDNAHEFPVSGPVQVLSNGEKIMPTGTRIYDPPSPLSAIRSIVPQANVAYADGMDVDAAVAVAKQSDIAIVFAEQWMTEGRDVADLHLSNDQDALIAAVATANPRTIVVLQTGGPVVMPWLAQASAVLEAWYSGSGGAAAIARVLFGQVNPSGKLPITFPQSEGQLPRPVIPVSATPRTLYDLDYNIEGADVGYKWFEKQNQAPLFSFGFGLSYSTFAITNLRATNNDPLILSADVTNTGTVDGMETVQFYAAPPEEDGQGIRRLIGFSKVNLKPGETRAVAVTPDPRLLSYFDAIDHVWRIPQGTQVITVGDSSASSSATTAVELSVKELPP